MTLLRAKGSTFDSEDNILVDLISDLGAVPEQEGIVFVKGHTTVNDGGGGSFSYNDITDRATANGGTIIDGTGTATGLGCWIREGTLSAFSLHWFGLDDSTTASLQSNIGIDGATVTITDLDSGGLFVFDSTSIAENDQLINFNGWVRHTRSGVVGKTSVTGGAFIPAGNTGQRPDNPNGTYGWFRFNTVNNEYEGYFLDGWQPIGRVPDPALNGYGLTTEVLTLSLGQLEATFATQVVEGSSIYMASNSDDGGRLIPEEDYTSVGGTITLTRSYPEGTVLALSRNDNGEAGGATLAIANAGYAGEWANKPEDVLVSSDAGGDLLDDYSAMHHATKAAADVATIGTSVSDAAASAAAASTSETNAGNSETNAAASAIEAQSYAGAQEGLVTIAAATGAVVLDANGGTNSVFHLTLTGNVTDVSISNVPVNAAKAYGATIIIVNDGSSTVNWGSQFTFVVTPTLTGTAGKRDFIIGLTVDDGTEFMCEMGIAGV